jgi:ubiquinone/menaquinone biosynthesis C-methylase UbiE
MYEQIVEALREAYDASARERELAEQENWKAEERQNFLELLREEDKSSLLEIGAGPGKDSQFFQENGLQVVATDLSPEMVNHCRRKGLNAHVMDFKHLNFRAEQFDAIYAINCLLHVPKRDLTDVLTSIRRILQPAGLLFVAVYGGQDSEEVWEDDHHRPQRFFSFHTDEQLIQTYGEFFTIYDFKQIKPTAGSKNLHVQRLILRKT